MKTILTIAFALFTLIFSTLSCARSTDLKEFDNIRFGTASGKVLTVDEAKSAIAKAAELGNWKVVDAGENKLTATLVENAKHTIIVEIICNADNLSIHYKDSINMNAEIENGVQQIHPAYHKWVKKLIRTIRTEIKKL